MEDKKRKKKVRPGTTPRIRQDTRFMAKGREVCRVNRFDQEEFLKRGWKYVSRSQARKKSRATDKEEK